METSRSLVLINALQLLLLALSAHAIAFVDISKVYVHQLVGVVDGHVTLPCDVIAPSVNDSLQLVFWYRLGEKAPFYTLNGAQVEKLHEAFTARNNVEYDTRGRRVDAGQHTVDDLISPRAMVQYQQHSAALLMRALRRTDAGIYSCRAEYLQSPSQICVANLSVIVPPSSLVVYDASGNEVKDLTPAIQLGDDLLLMCVVKGGDPRPTVQWRWTPSISAHQRDASSITEPDVRKSLHLRTVHRSNLLSPLTCVARNTNLTSARTHTVRLQLLLAPVSLRMRSLPSHLTAGRVHRITCEARGSRPPAAISWLHNGSRQLDNIEQMPSSDPNVTLSVLLLRPEATVQPVLITCTASNPRLTADKSSSSTLKQSRLLSVHFAPKLSVELGEQLNADLILEGASVYFQCRVLSSPAITQLYWTHKGRRLSTDRHSAITITANSLVINNVTRSRGGNYQCHAVNVCGHSNSQKFTLRVRYSPRCALSSLSVIRYIPGRPLTARCNLTADPAQIRFRWQMQRSDNLNSTETKALTKYTTEDTSSVVTLRLLSNTVSASLLCWGSNSVGRQQKPCVFRLMPAKRPGVPTGCSVTNTSTDTVEVVCLVNVTRHSSSSSQSQSNQLDNAAAASAMDALDEDVHNDYDELEAPITFTLEVRSFDGQKSLRNLTQESAWFLVSGLEPAQNYSLRLWATNARGSGPPLSLYATTETLIPDRIAFITSPSAVPVAVAAGGSLTLLLLLAVLTAVAAVRRQRRCNTTAAGDIVDTDDDGQEHLVTVSRRQRREMQMLQAQEEAHMSKAAAKRTRTYLPNSTLRRCSSFQADVINSSVYSMTSDFCRCDCRHRLSSEIWPPPSLPPTTAGDIHPGMADRQTDRRVSSESCTCRRAKCVTFAS